MIVKSNFRSNEGLGRWQEAISCLVEHVGRPRRIEFQKVCDSIADQLKKHTDIQGQEAPEAMRYKPILENLMPRLHGRPHANPRRFMREDDKRCELRLAAGDGCTTIPATVEDVCPSRYAGFRVETDAVRVITAFDHDVGLCDVWLDHEFRARRIDAFVVPESKTRTFDAAHLSLEFHSSPGEKRNLRVPCRIVRAWPLKDRDGTGMALLAAEEDRKALPAEWREYVDRLPSPARCQA
jgi:hypothetical protein